MHRTRSLAATAALSAALLAACGSGGDSDSAAQQSPSATPTASAAASAPASAPAASAAPAGDLASLSADEILVRAKEAGKRAGSVQVLGTVAQGGQSGRLDLQVQEGSGKGTIAAQGVEFDLVKVGEEFFLQGDERFYAQFGGGEEAAKLLEGKWLKGSPRDQQLGPLAGFLSVDTLLDQLLDPTTKLDKGEETTVDGKRAILLRTQDGRGELAVALEGEPYPLQLEPGEGNTQDTGKVTFSRWGERFDVTAPEASDVVDVAKLRPTAVPTPS